MELPPETSKRKQVFIAFGAILFMMIMIYFVRQQEQNLDTPTKDNTPQYISAYQYLQDNMNDPGSLSIVDYSDIAKLEDNKTAMRIKYRAKNRLGALVLENKLFGFDKNYNVIFVRDFTQ